MKYHEIIMLWPGIEAQEQLRKVLPEPWIIKDFVSFEQAENLRNGTKAYAMCAVPNDVTTPREDLQSSLHDAIDHAQFPDDGEDGHIGEVARIYGRGTV